MKHIFSYEVATFIFMFVIFLNYYLKSWIPIRRNQIFQFFLIVIMLFLASDIVLLQLLQRGYGNHVTLTRISSMVSYCGILITFMLQDTYYLALIGKMDYKHNKKILLSMVPGCFLIVVMIVTMVWHDCFFGKWQTSGDDMMYNSSIAAVIILAYMLVGFLILLTHISEIGELQTGTLLGYSIFQFIMVCVQYKMDGVVRISFYGVGALVLVMYVAIQKVDLNTDRASGCFRETGFNIVLKEAENYEKSFSVLNVKITNFRSLTNMCTSEEIEEIQRKIGIMLRGIAGKCNVFHIHGSEYVALLKNREAVQKAYDQCQITLPKTFQLNGRSLIIHYNFYGMNFEDVSYSAEDFIRLRESMRNEVLRNTQDDKLYLLEGELKEKVLQKMHICHLLKEMQEKEELSFMYHGIVTPDGRFCEIEFAPHIQENGMEIFNEQLWEAAKENGSIKSFGRLVFENVMKQTRDCKLLEHGIEKIHINMLPVQMSSVELISEYVGYAVKYGIPCDKICIEISEQLDISEKNLERCMHLMKKQGITMLLDRYGYDACNLKDTMNMPFDNVKISYNMLHSYCTGDSKILEYQIKMLRSRGWKIGIDGVDKKEYWNKVRSLHLDFLEGYYFPVFYSEEELSKYLQEKGE